MTNFTAVQGVCVKIPAVEADLHVVLTGLETINKDFKHKNVKESHELL